MNTPYLPKKKLLGSGSHMMVKCKPMENKVGRCYDCDDKAKCTAYHLLMDLTLERDVCPLNPVMEKCVVDGIYLPHTPIAKGG